jgi:hypothetical protein
MTDPQTPDQPQPSEPTQPQPEPQQTEQVAGDDQGDDDESKADPDGGWEDTDMAGEGDVREQGTAPVPDEQDRD